MPPSSWRDCPLHIPPWREGDSLLRDLRYPLQWWLLVSQWLSDEILMHFGGANLSMHTSSIIIIMMGGYLSLPGVNMPDHHQLFKQLKLRLCSTTTSHVVLLKSATCNAGTVAFVAMQNCCQRILLYRVRHENYVERGAPSGYAVGQR